MLYSLLSCQTSFAGSSRSCDLLRPGDFDLDLPSDCGVFAASLFGRGGRSLTSQFSPFCWMLANSLPPPGASQYMLKCGGSFFVPLNPHT